MILAIVGTLFVILGWYCLSRNWVLRGTIFFMGAFVAAGLMIATRVMEHWT